MAEEQEYYNGQETPENGYETPDDGYEIPDDGYETPDDQYIQPFNNEVRNLRIERRTNNVRIIRLNIPINPLVLDDPPHSPRSVTGVKSFFYNIYIKKKVDLFLSYKNLFKI